MAEKKYTIINCIKCHKPMNIRNDYIKKHSGVCISCQKKGNKQAYKDGRTKTRLYHIWIGLKFRRYKKYNPKVLFTSWEHFKEWALNNGYQDNLTIDRIDNKGDYSPQNCQWITLEENSGKDKKIFSDNEKIKLFIERQKLGLTQLEMAKKLNVSRNTIQRAERYAKGVI